MEERIKQEHAEGLINKEEEETIVDENAKEGGNEIKITSSSVKIKNTLSNEPGNNISSPEQLNNVTQSGEQINKEIKGVVDEIASKKDSEIISTCPSAKTTNKLQNESGDNVISSKHIDSTIPTEELNDIITTEGLESITKEQLDSILNPEILQQAIEFENMQYQHDKQLIQELIEAPAKEEVKVYTPNQLLKNNFTMIQAELRKSLHNINLGMNLLAFEILANVTDRIVNNCVVLGLTGTENPYKINKQEFWLGLNNTWFYCLSRIPLSCNNEQKITIDHLKHLKTLIVPWGEELSKYGLVDYQIGLWQDDLLEAIDLAISLIKPTLPPPPKDIDLNKVLPSVEALGLSIAKVEEQDKLNLNEFANEIISYQAENGNVYSKDNSTLSSLTDEEV